MISPRSLRRSMSERALTETSKSLESLCWALTPRYPSDVQETRVLSAGLLRSWCRVPHEPTDRRGLRLAPGPSCSAFSPSALQHSPETGLAPATPLYVTPISSSWQHLAPCLSSHRDEATGPQLGHANVEMFSRGQIEIWFY